MTFGNPAALWLGLLAIPVVICYLHRARPASYRVATGFLWERLAAQSLGRRLWRPWRHPTSLLVELALLGLVVLAAADPQAPSPRTLVLVIDNSASMNAADAKPSRLEEAKRQAADLIAGLRYGDRLAVISAGGSAVVRCGLSDDRDALQAALQGVHSTHGPTRVEEAVALGRRIAGDRPNRRIVVFSDGCFAGAGALSAADGVTLRRVGTRGDNLAVSRFAVRRELADPRGCQVFVEVASFSDRPTTCGLMFSLNGRVLASVPVSAGPNGRWREVFQMDAPGAGQITARLDRADDLAADNEAAVQLAAAPVRRVTLAGRASPCLEQALAALPAVELRVVDTPPSTAEEGRILVFDREVPGLLPGGPVLVVDPSSACDLWRLGDALKDAEVARQSGNGPFLGDVSLIGTQLGDSRRLVWAGQMEPLVRPLAWTADGTPLMCAVDRPAGRLLVVLGSLEIGDLAQQAVFPVLVGRALDWLAGDAAAAESPPAVVSASNTMESDLRAPDLPAADDDVVVSDYQWPVLWLLLAAAAGVLLLIEWGLYQRRWIC
jgi:hypothetical protein